MWVHKRGEKHVAYKGCFGTFLKVFCLVKSFFSMPYQRSSQKRPWINKNKRKIKENSNSWHHMAVPKTK